MLKSRDLPSSASLGVASPLTCIGLLSSWLGFDSSTPKKSSKEDLGSGVARIFWSSIRPLEGDVVPVFNERKGDCDRGLEESDGIANRSKGLLLLPNGIGSGEAGNGWAAAIATESGEVVLLG